jgi:hypothetical protein
LSPGADYLIDDCIHHFFAAGRDNTFSYGFVYPKKTANEMWDHAVGLAGTDECFFTGSIHNDKYTGMTASQNRHTSPKLVQVLCVKASRI